MHLPSKLWRIAALFPRVSEAKPRSADRSRDLSSFVVLENEHVNWYNFSRIMIRRAIILVVAAVLAGTACLAAAAPIQKIQGVISEVGEGYLWLKPDGDSQPRKFILRWKARFVPPKLPLKGDRVQILYKEKEAGLIVYGVNYLKPAPGSQRDTNEPLPKAEQE